MAPTSGRPPTHRDRHEVRYPPDPLKVLPKPLTQLPGSLGGLGDALLGELVVSRSGGWEVRWVEVLVWEPKSPGLGTKKCRLGLEFRPGE